MKELSIEEKAKAYDEALENIKKLVSCGLIYEDAAIQVFPELKENNDADIRTEIKNIITYFYGSTNKFVHLHTKEELLAWLEKKGEQKPTETEKGANGNDREIPNSAWSEEDEVGLCDTMWAIKQAKTIAKDENDMGNLWYAERWLKSFKDRVQPQKKQEWGEEDEKMIDNIIDYMKPMPIFFESTKGKSGKEYTKEFIKEAIDWLKSIRPQNTWKPSEVEMVVLNDIIINGHLSNANERILKDLQEQLKKLREE